VNLGAQLVFFFTGSHNKVPVSHAVRDAPVDYHITAYFECKTIIGTCLS